MLLAMAVAWPVSTCQTSSDEPVDTAQSERTARHSGPLRISSPTKWRRLNPRGSLLFTPAFSPDGRWLVASGPRGLGIYIVSTDGSMAPELLDSTYRGPRGWSSAPVALHFGHARLRAWHPGRADLQPGRRIWESPWDDDRGRRLHHTRVGTWHHHARLGTITFQQEGQTAVELGQARAWGAVVSPAGAHVAWCTGTLAEPQLHLFDARTQTTTELGPGVHPAWLPDGGHLVFARPAGVERLRGQSNVKGSELVLHDVAQGTSRALTETAEIAEMEPAVSPDGRFIVFVDWHGGGVYRARVLGGGAP